MHRLKVVLREEAIGDLADIYTYIERVSASPVTQCRGTRVLPNARISMLPAGTALRPKR
jgi:hypothetical protein